MAQPRTEALHRDAEGLDTQAPDAILRSLANGQIEASRAVLEAIPELAAAAATIAARLNAGGRVVYAAAGSSGLMALADALELPGTFGIAPERVLVLVAGGDKSFTYMAGGPEDDVDEASAAVAGADVGSGDCVIAISASGSTPYAMAAMAEARRRGAATVAIANNEGAALFAQADVAVLLRTPPEVIAGSTRMGAGTAQKIALNMISTLAAIHLGHVHDGYMVNLNADNAKLRARAARIVATVAGVTMPDAVASIERAGGSVKAAILLCAGAASTNAASEILERTGHRLRPALSEVRGEAGSDHPRSHQNRT